MFVAAAPKLTGTGPGYPRSPSRASVGGFCRLIYASQYNSGMGSASKQKKVVRWRQCPIIGLEHYDISDHGDVRRNKPGKTRQNTPPKGRENNGYQRYKLTNSDGKKLEIGAHQLVLRTFKGPPPTSKHLSAHNDGNGLNNYYENLRWATQKSNLADRDKHGTNIRGERNGRAKLTASQVLRLRRDHKKLLATGNTYGNVRALQKRYGLKSSSSFYAALSGQHWGHI